MEMRAMLLTTPRSIDASPLVLRAIDVPELKKDEIRVRVLTCGLCRTDLHVIEEELL